MSTRIDLPESWRFPSTRYRGSKRKLLPWIWHKLTPLAPSFDTVLDLFGGTGVVSLLFKAMGKQVTFNDYLRFNHQAGVAFVSNARTKISEEDMDLVLSFDKSGFEDGFITRTFQGFYFTDEENQWLDRVLSNVGRLSRKYNGSELDEKRALILWSVFQSCLIKRPFNLFHRRNLNLRTNDVPRKFGNHTTWQKPFPTAFRQFASEANSVVFDNQRENSAHCIDAFAFPSSDFDLVYLDPPYFFPGIRDSDYLEAYHFLEGLANYERWGSLIDLDTYNRRLKRGAVGAWPSRSYPELSDRFESLIDRYRRSMIVISHKSGSLVPVGDIAKSLERAGKIVRTHYRSYTYALSKLNGRPRKNIEWLLVAL